MFKSYEYIKYEYNKETNKYHHQIKIIDSGFEEVVVEIEVEIVAAIVRAVANVYKRRNLNVGHNIALLCIYLSKKWEDKTEQLTGWQDKYCPKYIDDWNEIKKDRDKFLQKYMLLA